MVFKCLNHRANKKIINNKNKNNAVIFIIHHANHIKPCFFFNYDNHYHHYHHKQNINFFTGYKYLKTQFCDIINTNSTIDTTIITTFTSSRATL